MIVSKEHVNIQIAPSNKKGFLTSSLFIFQYLYKNECPIPYGCYPISTSIEFESHINDDVIIIFYILRRKKKPTQNWSYEINRNKWEKKNIEFSFLRPNRWRIWHMAYAILIEQCRLLRLFFKTKKTVKIKMELWILNI